jgi:hypothetical protein
MTVQTLCGGTNSDHRAFFMRWLASLPNLLKRFEKFSNSINGGQSHPFDDTERCAVGMLAASATCANFLNLTEYRIVKMKDGYPRKNCRADLWVLDDALNQSFSFEFKRSDSPLSKNYGVPYWLAKAVEDVSEIPNDERDCAYGGVISYTDENLEDGLDLGQEDYGFIIKPKTGKSVYLFFREYRKP